MASEDEDHMPPAKRARSTERMVMICPDGLRGAEARSVMCVPADLYDAEERQRLVRVTGAHRLSHHTPGYIIDVAVKVPHEHGKPVYSIEEAQTPDESKNIRKIYCREVLAGFIERPEEKDAFSRSLDLSRATWRELQQFWREETAPPGVLAEAAARAGCHAAARWIKREFSLSTDEFHKKLFKLFDRRTAIRIAEASLERARWPADGRPDKSSAGTDANQSFEDDPVAFLCSHLGSAIDRRGCEALDPEAIRALGFGESETEALRSIASFKGEYGFEYAIPTKGNEGLDGKLPAIRNEAIDETFFVCPDEAALASRLAPIEPIVSVFDLQHAPWVWDRRSAEHVGCKPLYGTIPDASTGEPIRVIRASVEGGAVSPTRAYVMMVNGESGDCVAVVVESLQDCKWDDLLGPETECFNAPLGRPKLRCRRTGATVALRSRDAYIGVSELWFDGRTGKTAAVLLFSIGRTSRTPTQSAPNVGLREVLAAAGERCGVAHLVNAHLATSRMVLNALDAFGKIQTGLRVIGDHSMQASSYMYSHGYAYRSIASRRGIEHEVPQHMNPTQFASLWMGGSVRGVNLLILPPSRDAKEVQGGAAIGRAGSFSRGTMFVLNGKIGMVTDDDDARCESGGIEILGKSGTPLRVSRGIVSAVAAAPPSSASIDDLWNLPDGALRGARLDTASGNWSSRALRRASALTLQPISPSADPGREDASETGIETFTALSSLAVLV